MSGAGEHLTVYIVDDDDSVSDALMMLMRSVRQVAKRFRTAQEFLDARPEAMAGCLLLDVRMPGMSGLELQRELERRQVRLPTVFMTGHGDVPMAVDAMRSGAVDFLQKPFRDEDLLACVNRALERYRSDAGASQKRQQQQARVAALSPREREIARRIAQGQANKVIAADLEISLRTVEQHRANLMDKLEVRNVAELVRIMLDAEAGNGQQPV